MDKCLLKCYIYSRMVFGMKLYRDYLFLFFILFVSIIERTFCIWIFHTVITLKGVNSVKVGFIGAGKVGFSLGKYLKEQGIHISGYYSKSQNSAKSAADFTNTKKYNSIENLLSDSDTIFVTVPDSVIGEIWDYMKNLDIKNKNICHCSGSISSAAFFDAYKYGACVYSVHPLYAISSKFESYKELNNAYFTIEGSSKNINDIVEIFEKAGNKVIVTSPENKSLYHCGAVVASNLVVGLYSMGVDILESCGFEREFAKKALANLFIGNANAIVEKGYVEALTGPVERCDISTIEKHIYSIQNSDNLKSKENLLKIYLLLSEKLVEIGEEKHLNRDYSKVTEVINNEKHNINI